MAAMLALISAASFGISDFSGGLASRRTTATSVVLVSNGLSLVLGLLVAGLLPGSSFRTGDLAWGLAAGAVGLVGVVLLYRGLAIGPMSVVAPLTAVLSAAIPVLVGLARGERPGAPAMAGLVLALPAIVLISRERGSAGNRISNAALGASLVAGVGFGGFFVLLAQTGTDGGAWPLVAQRTASVGLLLASVALPGRHHRSLLPTGSTLVLALLAGATDFGANLAYLLATHRGLLALVAVLSSLYPAATVLLARGFLSERLGATQLAGLGVAALAIVMIAA